MKSSNAYNQSVQMNNQIISDYSSEIQIIKGENSIEYIQPQVTVIQQNEKQKKKVKPRKSSAGAGGIVIKKDLHIENGGTPRNNKKIKPGNTDVKTIITPKSNIKKNFFASKNNGLGGSINSKHNVNQQLTLNYQNKSEPYKPQ